MTELTRYQFFLSSNQRNSGQITDANYNLKIPISLKALNSAFFIQVNSVEIPFSFYQLNNEINTLNCTFRNGMGTKNSTITLSQGNYNSISVLNLLKDKLITEAQLSEGIYTGFIPVFSFSYSSSTGKMTFLLSNADCDITLKFSENKSLGIFYGFENNVTINNSPLISTKYCVANPITSLYIRSPSFKQTNNGEFIVENDVYSDIIKQVPVLTGQNTYIQDFQDSDLIYISNNQITDFNIYLSSNLSYTPLDLQGLNWSITFTIIEMITPEYKPIVPIINTYQLNISPISQISQEKEGISNEPDSLRSSILSNLSKYKDLFTTNLESDRQKLEKLLKRKKDKNIAIDKDKEDASLQTIQRE